MSFTRPRRGSGVRHLPGRTAALGLAVGAVLAGETLIALPQAAASAAPAPAPAATHSSPHRLTPRGHGAASPAVIGGQLINSGGPVQAAPVVYLDFWGWTSDPQGEQPYLTNFLSSVGSSSWLATVNQYGGGSLGHLLAGTWSDPAPVPAAPSDAQIQAEAASAAAHFGTGGSVNVQIVVATPTGHSTPGFNAAGGFCAYHGAVASNPSITYTDLPYIPDAGANCGQGDVNGANGTLDGVSIVEGHELAEAVTDPLINAWKDAGGNEIADKCAWSGLANINTPAGTFAVQPLWSNGWNQCVLFTHVFPPAQIAFQANTGTLWTAGPAGGGNTQLGVMAGTSPSVTALYGGGHQIAFQANNGDLWTTGDWGTGDLGLGMKAGTSPSIAALPRGGFEIAFQANTGVLWTTGTAGTTDWNLGMNPVSSPGIAASQSGGYEAAFSGSDNYLWTAGTAGTSAVGLSMRPGTSPSVAALPGTGYEVAFQFVTGALWTTGDVDSRFWSVALNATSSPSISSSVSTGGYDVAYEASNNDLSIAVDSTYVKTTSDLGLGMASGTDPAITFVLGTGYQMAFQANTGALWTDDSVAGARNYGLGMRSGTSPSIA